MVTVKDFIKGFKEKKVINTYNAPDAIHEYIRTELEVKNYIPFVEKRELCANVLNACNTKEDNGLVKVDSVSRYILFTIAVITKYTNLEFSSGEDDPLDEYDMLCQADLLNPILDVIGGEYTACNNILNMMMADIVANNNTVENVLGELANTLSEAIDDFSDVLSEKVKSLNLDLNQINIDKYKWLIEKFIKK